MAENSLQQAGREIATADRYQVIMSVDATDLITSSNTADTTAPTKNVETPSKRPTIKGVGPIARETALRIACDCSLSTHITANGESLDIGRKSRIWTNAQSRAMKERDQHCRFPGCTRTHNLENHHLDHWAKGGHTSVSRGVSLCKFHHILVHEGGYTIERVDNNEHRIDEEFEQQRHADDASLFDFEKDLRNDRESFETIRKLSPTRFGIRVLNAEGVDIRTLPNFSVEASQPVNNRFDKGRLDKGRLDKDPRDTDPRDTDPRDTDPLDASDAPASYRPCHSTRVDCSEPEPPIYDCKGGVSGREESYLQPTHSSPK